MPVRFLVHADGRHAHAEISCIVARQFFFDRTEISKILMQDLLQFRVLHVARPSVNDENGFYVGMEETLMQHAFADHACGTGNDSFYFHMQAL
jgi:hypothetical protein